MTTVLTDAGEFEVPDAAGSDGALWLSGREAEDATGWVAKSEGICKGDICVPLPPGREQEFVRGSRLNLVALWRHLGQPAVHSDRGHVWVLGASARVDDVLTANYHRLKVGNGYSPDDVNRKRLALEGVLVPLTAEWNERLLLGAGFHTVDCFWAWGPFRAWVAVK